MTDNCLTELIHGVSSPRNFSVRVSVCARFFFFFLIWLVTRVTNPILFLFKTVISSDKGLFLTIYESNIHGFLSKRKPTTGSEQ